MCCSYCDIDLKQVRLVSHGEEKEAGVSVRFHCEFLISHYVNWWHSQQEICYIILHNLHNSLKCEMAQCFQVHTVLYRNALEHKRNSKEDLCTLLSTFWLSGRTLALCFKSTQLECLLFTWTKCTSSARSFTLTINHELSWKWWSVHVRGLKGESFWKVHLILLWGEKQKNLPYTQWLPKIVFNYMTHFLWSVWFLSEPDEDLKRCVSRSHSGF